MDMPRVIKRYRNRKLYDTTVSSYVTLEDISALVKAGHEVLIIDKTTGEDITNVTLAQIILENQKRLRIDSDLPRTTLRAIVESGGELLSMISSPVAKMSDDLRKRAERLEESRNTVIQSVLDTTQRRLEETQQRIDDGIKDALSQVTHVPRLRTELRETQRRVTVLEAELSRVKVRLDELTEREHRSGRPRSLPAQKSNPTRAV